MILEIIPVGAMGVNCYILASGNDSKAVIIDPGDDADKIFNALKRHRLRAGLVINTHGHYDHIGCDDKFGLPVYVHKADLPMLKDPKLNFSAFFAVPYQVESEILVLEEGQIIGLDDINLKVLHIPGHTPGGIALVLMDKKEKMVFTGDTLFCQGIGRSDLEGGNGDLLVKLIKEKLLTLPPDTIVYPGHGESSTIKAEKNNPYLNA
ncbi:MAG: MBL fold metallo-hydrolase [Candidatus Omnitrophota bacterium]|jgi:glyoxylase-like metal-dependent hydrolase (beta-lactamase superfamily II)